MAITLRDLLSRVSPYRPDLNSALGEAQAMFALYDSARKIARETFILRQDTGFIHVPANTHSIDVRTLVTDASVLRVWDVYYNRIPLNNGSYLGTWNPSTNTPALSNSSVPASGSWYLCSEDGNMALGTETSWTKGDLVYSGGNGWLKKPFDKAEFLAEKNKPTIDSQRPTPQSSRGDTREYSQENGVVFFYTPPRYDCVVRFNVAVVPTDRDMESYEFPEEAEDVIIAGARAALLELPGEGHSIQLAMAYKQEMKDGIGRLKAVGLMGWGAYAEYDQSSFTGRGR